MPAGGPGSPVLDSARARVRNNGNRPAYVAARGAFFSPRQSRTCNAGFSFEAQAAFSVPGLRPSLQAVSAQSPLGVLSGSRFSQARPTSSRAEPSKSAKNGLAIPLSRIDIGAIQPLRSPHTHREERSHRHAEGSPAFNSSWDSLWDASTRPKSGGQTSLRPLVPLSDAESRLSRPTPRVFYPHVTHVKTFPSAHRPDGGAPHACSRPA